MATEGMSVEPSLGILASAMVHLFDATGAGDKEGEIRVLPLAGVAHGARLVEAAGALWTRNNHLERILGETSADRAGKVTTFLR
jgi:hypothetical protein